MEVKKLLFLEISLFNIFIFDVYIIITSGYKLSGYISGKKY